MLKRKSYYALIDQCLSRELRGDVRYLISNNLFAHVWWLAKCEREFLEDLSVFIQREAFAAKEKIPSGPDILNILMQVRVWTTAAAAQQHTSASHAHLFPPLLSLSLYFAGRRDTRWCDYRCRRPLG